MTLAKGIHSEFSHTSYRYVMLLPLYYLLFDDDEQNDNKTITECVVITMTATMLLRSLLSWHTLGFQFRYMYQYRYVICDVISCHPTIYILDDKQNNNRIPGRNQRLMKSNSNVKNLVKLGLAACNRYRYHIECDKENIGGDVTGGRMQVSAGLLYATISTVAKRTEEAGGTVY